MRGKTGKSGWARVNGPSDCESLCLRLSFRLKMAFFYFHLDADKSAHYT
jgi:hypothetical protein